MKINRLALLKALQAVRPGLAKSLVIEQSTCFVFTDGAVCTFNDEISVSAPIDVDFEGAVPAKELFDMVTKFKKAELEFEVKDGALLIVGGAAKVGINIDPDIELPIQELGIPEDEDWSELPEKFCKAVKFCLFSVSRDPDHKVLHNIFVNGSYTMSSDNNRITKFDMGEEAEKAFPEELLIPANAARSIIEYAPIEYARTPGWIHFRNDEDAMFSCRDTDDDYPDYEEYLIVDGTTVEFPENIAEILDKASVMCQDKRVCISLTKNKLTVSTEGVNGWFEESVRIVYTGEELDFDIQPEFLKSMIKSNRKAVVGNTLKFEGEDYVHVVNLMEPKEK
jgi:DNA polymerase III sliding clamp (beta) subunit (PCNA family)